ncbi:hypothetical protein AYK26_06455 [Euryarchaeota archaeon SM23-78]|nr:MAG: hypothetical protein AYK26_06455 [Euryarchaeota archaeon SM23-78]MBW3001070.1 hypothetical protein [Candidatus Woesearchaeota archaeon]
MVEKRGEPDSVSTHNKLILQKAVDKRINHILTKAFISEREVYDLVRSFFKKFLHIDYEFTREELLSELKKVYLTVDLKKKVGNLFDSVAEIEHTSKVFPKEHLEKILLDFKKVADELTGAHYQQEKTFFKKLGHSIHKIFSRKHRKMLKIDEAVLSENERVIVKMNMLLDNSKRWLNKNMQKSKEAYHELIELYNSLDDARKDVYYQPIKELYTMIKAREKTG